MDGGATPEGAVVCLPFGGLGGESEHSRPASTLAADSDPPVDEEEALAAITTGPVRLRR